MSISNPKLALAHEYVAETNCHIFLTGKAGTGKTTFLQTLKKKTAKRMIVTAPTGVAAINAGGVTLHSFFQMPFGPFLPGSAGEEQQRRFNKQKIQIIKSLDLLVIDEISMVRADLLDGVDAVLRRYRRAHLPFGGVQLLMIGDLHQLPPVVKEAEWRLLQPYYDSPYFFSSKALGQSELVAIELEHIYRQTDLEFIKLLNRVRDNSLDPATLQTLNQRYIPDFSPADHEGYIILSTHNSKVDTTNHSKLDGLASKAHQFQAVVEGEFPEYSYPTAALLEVKVGAQVMFVRNDSSPEKLYFNGKIGKVTKIADREIRVQCPGEAKEIVVEPATWENITYEVDATTKEIVENKIGKFIQYPLKLAWAITIHKSQGLTFERAVIDAQSAFAHGQVYVALSRCKTFGGLILSSPITAQAVKTDPTVLRFTAAERQGVASPAQLAAAKIAYQQRLLLDCFDFSLLGSHLQRLTRVGQQNAQLLHLSGVDDLGGLSRTILSEIVEVGERFKRQLQALFAHHTLPEADPAILERVGKASVYFQEKIDTLLGGVLKDLTLDTDNKELRKLAKNALARLTTETAVKMAAVKSCASGFAPAGYLRALSGAELDLAPPREKKGATAEYTAAQVGQPELFQRLKEWRTKKAEATGLAPVQIIHQKTLIQLAVALPDTLAALKKIKGIGPQALHNYGEELVALIGEYRRDHEIVEVLLPEPAISAELVGQRGKERGDTKKVSLELFHTGLALGEIAEKRGLSLATIEGHLAFWVEEGALEIGELLAPEKLHTISKTVQTMSDKTLSEIKAALGDHYTYGEIKLTKAHLKHLLAREM